MMKLNNTYTLQEMKEKGLQLKSRSKEKSPQKSFDHSFILSEFIL